MSGKPAGTACGGLERKIDVSNYQQALDICTRIGDRNGQFEALFGLGHGDTDRAVQAWPRALDLLDALGLEAIEEVTAAEIRASLKSAGP